LFPDFQELRGQQFTEYRTDTHVGKIIACPADRAGARGVISMLGMIERLLHEPGERLRTVRTDRLTDQFNELRVQLQKVQHLPLSVQSLDRDDTGADASPRRPFDVERWAFSP